MELHSTTYSNILYMQIHLLINLLDTKIYCLFLPDLLWLSLSD